ncbi:MAG: hypothetical protein WED07_00565 [Candidatus Freyarchaeum deiterrae]
MRINVSDFKMFEKAPYDKPDAKTIIDLALKGVTEVEKTYGPVFTNKLINYALQFISKKTGEISPPNIKTLEQLGEYLIQKTDKYPYTWCAISYAQVKTESDLQGRTGAGTQVEVIGVGKKLAEGACARDKNVDIAGIALKFNQTMVALKVSPKEMGYLKDGNEAFYLLWKVCPTLDACREASKEKLLIRPNGKMRCSSGATACRLFKLITGCEWDYELEEFDKPYCAQKFLMV